MRLLLVEDDDALTTVLRRALAEESYAVDVAGSIGAADLLLASESYDLIVLDRGLPDGDGLDLCARLRDEGSAVPVLVLTARDAMRDKVDGLDSGADDYLPKPFDYPELAARVRALLRRPAEVRPPVLEYAGLRLDVAAHQLSVDGVVTPLTAKEFGLLEYLLARQGEVVRRTDLLEHVWDAHYDGLSNVVDVHVANLRRKLDGAGREGLVETVRGVGYRLGAPADPR